MTIVEAKDGRATLTMPFYLDLAQGGGLMHGGALVSLADTAVAMAIKSLLPQETLFATIGLEAKFLRAVRQGVVTAIAEIAETEAGIITGKATVYDKERKPVMEFSSTFKVSRRKTIEDVTYEEP